MVAGHQPSPTPSARLGLAGHADQPPATILRDWFLAWAWGHTSHRRKAVVSPQLWHFVTAAGEGSYEASLGLEPSSVPTSEAGVNHQPCCFELRPPPRKPGPGAGEGQPSLEGGLWSLLPAGGPWARAASSPAGPWVCSLWRQAGTDPVL